MSLTIKVIERMVDRLPKAIQEEIMSATMINMMVMLNQSSMSDVTKYKRFVMAARELDEASVIKRLGIKFDKKDLQDSKKSYDNELNFINDILDHKMSNVTLSKTVMSETPPLPILAIELRNMLSSALVVSIPKNNVTRIEDFRFYRTLILSSLLTHEKFIEFIKEILWYRPLKVVVFGSPLIGIGMSYAVFSSFEIIWSILFTLLTAVAFIGYSAKKCFYDLELFNDEDDGMLQYPMFKSELNPLVLTHSVRPDDASEFNNPLYRPFVTQVLGAAILTDEVTTHIGADQAVQRVLDRVRELDESVVKYYRGAFTEDMYISPSEKVYPETSSFDIDSKREEIQNRLLNIEANTCLYEKRKAHYDNTVRQLSFPEPTKLGIKANNRIIVKGSSKDGYDSAISKTSTRQSRSIPGISFDECVEDEYNTREVADSLPSVLKGLDGVKRYIREGLDELDNCLGKEEHDSQEECGDYFNDNDFHSYVKKPKRTKKATMRRKSREMFDEIANKRMVALFGFSKPSRGEEMLIKTMERKSAGYGNGGSTNTLHVRKFSQTQNVKNTVSGIKVLTVDTGLEVGNTNVCYDTKLCLSGKEIQDLLDNSTATQFIPNLINAEYSRRMALEEDPILHSKLRPLLISTIVSKLLTNDPLELKDSLFNDCSHLIGKRGSYYFGIHRKTDASNHKFILPTTAIISLMNYSDDPEDSIFQIEAAYRNILGVGNQITVGSLKRHIRTLVLQERYGSW